MAERARMGSPMSARRRQLGGFLDPGDFVETAADLKNLGIRTAEQARKWLKDNGITDTRGWDEMIEQNFAGKAAGAAVKAGAKAKPGEEKPKGGPSKQELIGTVGVAILAIAMLLWALFGSPHYWSLFPSPPYAFYGVMKWVVAGSCCYSAWGCWKLNRALAPMCLILLSVAGIHLLGKMRKAEWPLFNWVGVAGLGLVVFIMVVALKRIPRTEKGS